MARVQIGYPELADLRKRSVVGFRNYIVFYRVSAEIVEVVRVLHGAREIASALREPHPED